MLSLYSPLEIALRLAGRIKARRLRRGWTQDEMARRAGIKKPTYIHFERTGHISLLRLLKLLQVLALVQEFEKIGESEDLHGLSMDDFVRPERKRGSRTTR